MLVVSFSSPFALTSCSLLLTETWTEATASVPWTGRGYHCSVVFDKKLWILGGSPMNNDVWSTPSALEGSV